MSSWGLPEISWREVTPLRVAQGSGITYDSGDGVGPLIEGREMMRLLSQLERIRSWIDAGIDDDGIVSPGSQARPPGVADEFLLQVACEICAVLDDEAFTPPGGSPFLPGKFVVFLSGEDDRQWQGDKRRGLREGLDHSLRLTAGSICGRRQLKKLAFAIELRVDGTLDKGQFRVKAFWDDDGSQTSVVPFNPNSSKTLLVETPPENEVTVVGVDPEVTVVNPEPHVVLYSIEVKRNGERQDLFSVTKPEITIGRSSQSVAVDLPIRGDAEVSRLHAVLARDAQGSYWLTPKGQNPVFLNDDEVQASEQVLVNLNDEIRICSFSLRIHAVAQDACPVLTDNDEAGRTQGTMNTIH
jgi:hypothetical protein